MCDECPRNQLRWPGKSNEEFTFENQGRSLCLVARTDGWCGTIGEKNAEKCPPEIVYWIRAVSGLVRSWIREDGQARFEEGLLT